MERGSDEVGALRGLRIIVTRPRSQSGDLAGMLENLGARVHVLPTIKIEGPRDPQPLDLACRAPGSFDWLVMTSANAVQAFASAVQRAGGRLADWKHVSTCAVGPATARAMTEEGLDVDVVPGRYLGAEVLSAIEGLGPVGGRRFLLPRSEQATDVLPRLLRTAGAEVTEVIAYRTVRDVESENALRSLLARGEADLVVFASGTAVHGFMDIAADAPGELAVATIGPVTSAVAREYGLSVDIEAVEHSAEGLVAAILEKYT